MAFKPNRYLLSVVASFFMTTAFAQKLYLPHKGEIEFFAGVDLQYSDKTLWRQYDFLINLTPGVKWHITPHTQLAAQGLIPIVNQWGDYYKNPRLNVLTLSHEMKFGRLALKPTIGLFTQERYGIDLKAAYPLTSWLALQSEIGYTGFCSMATGWEMSHMTKVMALGGFTAYINRYNVELQVLGGHFLKDDNGVLCQLFRHFTHASVGVFVQYSDNPGISSVIKNDKTVESSHNVNAGFKIVAVLPPYKRKHKKVSIRPAEVFNFSYNMNADSKAIKMYDTDPEQNIRHGWFSPDILPFGVNSNVYDFKEKEAVK